LIQLCGQRLDGMHAWPAWQHLQASGPGLSPHAGNGGGGGVVVMVLRKLLSLMQQAALQCQACLDNCLWPYPEADPPTAVAGATQCNRV